MANRILSRLYQAMFPRFGGEMPTSQELQDYLARRDQDLEQAIENLRQELLSLRSEPVMFAWAIATTDGAGGVRPNAVYGCSVEVAGTTVRMRFDTERPNIEYITGGMALGSFPRMVVMPTAPPFASSKTTGYADHRIYDDTGAIVSASTVSFSASYWAMGPR